MRMFYLFTYEKTPCYCELYIKLTYSMSEIISSVAFILRVVSVRKHEDSAEDTL